METSKVRVSIAIEARTSAHFFHPDRFHTSIDTIPSKNNEKQATMEPLAVD
jgi:hypothetical protein